MDQLDCQVIKARQVILVTKVLLGLWGQLAILEIKALRVLRDHKGNKDRIGSVTSTPLSLLPTSLCRLRSRHWAPSTMRVANSCWNLVVVELGCPAIQERLFSFSPRTLYEEVLIQGDLPT